MGSEGGGIAGEGGSGGTGGSGEPGGPIRASLFGMNFSGGNAPAEYSTLTVSIGNMGKESAAEWGWIEPNRPVGAGCPGTVNCTHSYDWSTLDGYVATASAHNLP